LSTGLPAIPAAATAAAAVSTTAAATAAILLRPGFVHVELSAVEVTTVESGNGFVAFAVIGHFHEAESACASGVPVGHDVYTINGAVLLEHGSNSAFRRVEAKVSYENIFH
jgi:hypothetical protein